MADTQVRHLTKERTLFEITIVDLVNDLVDDWGVKISVEFGTSRGSAFYPGRKVIRFGSASVKQAYMKGFWEYACLRNMTWKWLRKDGMCGVMMLVLHEYSHAITREMYGPGVEPHGYEYQEVYRTVLKQHEAKLNQLVNSI